jgi:hypothetical protein
MRNTKITILNTTDYAGYESNLHRTVSKKNKRKPRLVQKELINRLLTYIVGTILKLLH